MIARVDANTHTITIVVRWGFMADPYEEIWQKLFIPD
tara:strand:- start:575 stop:685 length:111 start_codon:yes stop_codon:yes gene_type:complete